MKVTVSYRSILRLAAPIALSLMIPQVSLLVDTAFLGSLGELELAVNGVAGIYYLVLSMIGHGLGNGVQILLARRAGEGDAKGLAKTFSNGIVLSFVLSLTMVLLSTWLGPALFRLTLNDSSIVAGCASFLNFRIWGLPFLMLTQLANVFFISTSRSRFLIYGALASTLVNIVLDYLLIFGHYGFPAMGLEGAALASAIAEVAYCLVMFGIFYGKGFHRLYPVTLNKYFDKVLSLRMLKLSSPLIVQYLFSVGGWQAFFIFVEHLGQRELAASQILRSIFGLATILTWAFAATCNTMVSNVIGQQKHHQVLPLIGKVAKLSFGLTATIAVAILLNSESLISLYRSDPGLVAFSTPSLRVIILATLIVSVSTVLFNGVVGTGNTLINLAIEITCVLAYLVYCYIVIEQYRMPLHWAWGAELVYWTSLLVISFLYLRTGKWRGKVL